MDSCLTRTIIFFLTIQLGFNYRFGGSKFQAKSRRERNNGEKKSGG